MTASESFMESRRINIIKKRFLPFPVAGKLS